LISVVLALAIGFTACLVLIPREIVVQPIMYFSPTMQMSLVDVPEQAPELPSTEKHGKTTEDTGLKEWFQSLLEEWLDE